jgi:short-subunit dehydrogenase
VKNQTSTERKMPKSILITGASSGIGKAVALEMSRRGYSVGLTARRTDELEKIRTTIQEGEGDGQCFIRRLDVTDTQDVPVAVEELAEQLGGLDIVFANAGIGMGEKIGRGEFSKARKTIKVNVIGAMATVDAGVEYFLRQGRGHIVGTCSVAAFRGMPRSSSYSASKAAFAVYLEAARAELFRKSIDVTVLYPGYIDTPLNDMLPSRPFLITVEKGAVLIADMIGKKVKSSTVPVWPWGIVARILRILPASIISKF